MPGRTSGLSGFSFRTDGRNIAKMRYDGAYPNAETRAIGQITNFARDSLRLSGEKKFRTSFLRVRRRGCDGNKIHSVSRSHVKMTIWNRSKILLLYTRNRRNLILKA